MNWLVKRDPNIERRTPRQHTDHNPRSLGAVKSYPPYWNRAEQPSYKGRCVAVMRTFMSKTPLTDPLDQEQYDGKFVRRTWRPTR